MIFRSSHGIGCWSQLRLTSLGGYGNKLAPPVNIERVGGSIGIASARLRVGHGWAGVSVPVLCHRTYANRAVSRPKAHTGRTTSAPKKKPATQTGKKAAAQPKRKKAPQAQRQSGTAAKSRSKARRPRKTSKAKSKAKRKTRKPLSEATKLRLARKKKAADVKRLKERALSPPSPAGRSTNTWITFLAEQRSALRESDDPAVDGSPIDFVKAMKARYRALSPAQREHYNHIANQKRATYKVRYTKWLESLTPAQIKDANFARIALRHRGLKPATVLKDERLVTKPRAAYIWYLSGRIASGDYRGLPPNEAVKLIASEWNASTPAEKKKYQDQQKQDGDRYVQEYKTVYGVDAPFTYRKKYPRTPSTRASSVTVQ